MFHHLRGTLYSKSPEEAVVEAGGLGYAVRIPLSTYEALPPEGGECFLYLDLSRRDEGDVLYGFATPQERRMFRLLTTVSRVGPALALALLSAAPVSRLADAIRSKDTAFLASLKGLGRTSSQRIVVELADKMDELAVSAGRVSPVHSDAVKALEALGMDPAAAARAVSDILAEAPADAPPPRLQDLIVAALQRLQRG
ncbi:MAG: Holliday junction branch migration protein RuvA [Planctomycetota bacterium]|nr:MAG: Holliday junction branch migration protein RuvA [Planctomycetota bacterium]